MRIACPHCHATYDVPDALLAGGGKQVRCARCGKEWSPAAGDTRASSVEATAPSAARVARARPAAPPPPVEDDDLDEAPRFPVTSLDELPPPSERSPLRASRSPLLGPRRSEIPEEPDEPLPSPAEVASPRRRRRGPLRGWLLSLVLILAVISAGVIWRQDVIKAWPASERLYRPLGLVEALPAEPAATAAAPAPAEPATTAPAPTTTDSPAAQPPAEPAKN
jgi:predicted Zn finger-like uncharacterized protein